MTKRTNPRSEPGALPPANLATGLAALESQSSLPDSRRRDLRSAVKARVAHLLGNAPAATPLAMETIQDRVISLVAARRSGTSSK